MAETKDVSPRSVSSKATQRELGEEKAPVQSIANDFVEKIIEPQLRHVNNREGGQGKF